MATGAARPPSATDRAYDHIRAAILSGRAAAGQMLSENDVAAQLSVSRTPVRAALTRLQSEGWVTVYAQRGALVRELTDREVREAAQLRHALETAGVRRADPRAREELARTLAGDVDAQEEALRAGDYAAFTDSALRFHRAFVALAGNDLVLEVYDQVQDRQQQSIVRSAGRVVGDRDRVLAEHRALLAAAAEGDWVAFAELLDAHQTASHGVDTPARAVAGLL